MSTLFTTGFVWTAMAADAACTESMDDQQILGLVFAGQDAFSALDAERFSEKRTQILDAIPCLAEPISTSAAAGVHRIRTLDAFLRRAPGDLELAARAWAEVDPTPPARSIAPAGHAVRNAWEAARAAGPSELGVLPVPEAGRVLVDGADRLSRSKERPTILQFVNQDRTVAWSVLVEPGEPTPTYAIAPEAARDAYDNALMFRAARKPAELVVIAGALAAGAVGTYTASAVTRRRFIDSREDADLDRLQNTTNGLAITSVGLGLGAAGVGLWAVRKW